VTPIIALALATAASGAVDASALTTIYPGVDRATNAWSGGATGAGVGIAIVDSGVTPNPDLGTRLVQVALPDQSGSLDDTVGHGTLVAGIAAGASSDGHFIGIAPGATIYALNVARPDGSVNSGDVITALKWVFDHAHQYNIRVVNLSLTETTQSSYKTSILDLAVERLWASGVFVVAAAGNRGANGVDYAPANDPLAMTVGAYDMMDTAGPGDDTALSWSSWGATVDGYNKPEELAPGRHIASNLAPGSLYASQAPAADIVAPGYVRANGTSFAAPQMAGAAAIAFQTHPGYSPDQVKWLLLAKAGHVIPGTKIPSLDLSAVYNYAGTPGNTNQAIPALVCAPGSTKCTNGSTIASKWDSSSWTSSSWTSSSWTLATWNSSSWTAAADWSSSSWTSSSWTSLGWAMTGWDTAAWD
jgi:serine protease AprX